MSVAMFDKSPKRSAYDVVIIGGAIMGSSTAFFLSDLEAFNGSVLVIERDGTYEKCSTAHTNSCIRMQFSSALNVRISQFGADFIQDLPARMGGDPRVPDISIQNYGYLYLADNEDFAESLRKAQGVQLSEGAETELLSAQAITERYPFYNTEDLVLGSINTKDEGYWDGGAVFDWFRRIAQERGVEYVENEVVAINRSVDGATVQSVTLASGEVVSCSRLVNATGPRGARTAAMAGLDIPVEPRKRFTWVFSAEQPLDQELPLTIDPSGVHMRQDGPKTYLAGCPANPDPAVEFDDFAMDYDRWESHVWPIIANRIPQFEAIKVVTEWAGHYAFNTLDQNAIIGPHSEVENFYFLNGFSGHGLQQSPAMGRGMAEILTFGSFKTLDLSPLGYDRIAAGNPYFEAAVI